MKKFLAIAMAIPMMGVAPLALDLCRGFVPENDMRIPVSADGRQEGGISEAEFNKVIDQASAFYAPVIKELGATLKVNRLWKDATVNASAQQSGKTWIVNMYGGLARHPTITVDGFMLVICHELGHHLGGAPKIKSFFGNAWASNEGQSDYFASLKCMRNVFVPAETDVFVQTQEIEAPLRANCETNFKETSDINACMRMGMAGRSVSMLFKELRKETKNPEFETPDQNIVTATNDAHPATQCRMDTYFQGALCSVKADVGLSNTDATVGTCTEKNDFKIGLRPRCWFKGAWQN